MHKLDKYITSLVEDKQNNIIRSARSSYYNFNGNVLRVSDHIGQNSSGNISIIKTNNINQYVVHNHKTGDIKVLNYEDTKKLAKSFDVISPLFKGVEDANFNIAKETLSHMENQLSVLRKRMKGETTSGQTILGIPKERFTKGQITTIQSFIKQIAFCQEKK